MNKDITVFLQHILTAVECIEDFTVGFSKKDFLNSVKTQDAVIRRLEIIGEAAKSLPTLFLEEHQEVPWREMIRMRDKLIHGYFGVDLDIAWNVVEEDIPVLKREVKKILLSLKPEDKTTEN